MINRLVILVTAILVLTVINFKIYEKEQLLVEGTPILLELAPVDPRSLMQGDYMILRYKLARSPELQNVENDGYLIITPDKNQVAQLLGIYEAGMRLSTEELRLRYRKRGHEIQLGAESFFFQEGHAQYYDKARYGELRVTSSGESVLVGLRDAAFKPLIPPAK